MATTRDALAVTPSTREHDIVSGDRPLRVLVVDDDVEMLDMYELILHDHELLRATSADEALEIFGSNVVDLVCSDYDMPGRNGVELLTEIAALRPWVTRVLITGVEGRRMTAAARSATSLIVKKPIDWADLAKLVTREGQLGRMRRAVHTARNSGSFPRLADDA